MQHTATDRLTKKRRAALWVLCTVLAVLCAVAVTYYWRVFYEYTAVPAHTARRPAGTAVYS